MDGDFRSKLNPTEGHILAGVQIDQYRFLARVKTTQLFQIAPDPRDSEDKRKLSSSKEAQDHRTIRDEVQRLFEGAKAKNVIPYAEYIIGLRSGQQGITPTIILYSEDALPTAIDEQFGLGAISIPWGKKLVAIDGETQLAARHEAANRDPATTEEYVAVYVCHGRSKNWARQAFHDLNVLAIRPNAAVSIGMDARDPLTGITRQVESKVPFFTDRVNKTRRQLRGTDADITTIAALRGGCITVAEGIGGVRYGAKPVSLSDQKVENVQNTAIEWWKAVTDAIGPSLEDREGKISSAPAVLSAIGAMGHLFLNVHETEERQRLKAEQIEKLRNVDWSRGKHWEGIAGKFTPKGAFSIGGSKETSYAIFEALNDPNSAAYAQVRKKAPAASVIA